VCLKGLKPYRYQSRLQTPESILFTDKRIWASSLPHPKLEWLKGMGWHMYISCDASKRLETCNN
jgi:hypothetical protein